ncbi:MAG: acyl-CoA thioesterase [Bacteroidetes bacterium]|nr:acyl-CoA thioesterase [Bacteroidota bacterium]MDA1337118.1 acyl-CoA thioesterase [Bacteroidota bacterium]
MSEPNLPDCQIYRPEIRFVDIDAAGIVNNAVYLNYFEQSRIHFFEGIVGKKWNWNEAGMVVARHEIDYQLPILFNDDVRIITWIDHVGEKSIKAAYVVQKQMEGKWLRTAKANTILVSYDHINGKTIPWPDKMVAGLHGFGIGCPECL